MNQEWTNNKIYWLIEERKKSTNRYPERTTMHQLLQEIRDGNIHFKIHEEETNKCKIVDALEIIMYLDWELFAYFDKDFISFQKFLSQPLPVSEIRRHSYRNFHKMMNRDYAYGGKEYKWSAREIYNTYQIDYFYNIIKNFNKPIDIINYYFFKFRESYLKLLFLKEFLSGWKLMDLMPQITQNYIAIILNDEKKYEEKRKELLAQMYERQIYDEYLKWKTIQSRLNI